MSALEELWLWLQGRTRTEAGPEPIEPGTDANANHTAASTGDATDDDAARIRRNWRYRAGPWQLK